MKRNIEVTVNGRSYSVLFDGDKVIEIVGLYRRGPTQFWKLMWAPHFKRFGNVRYEVTCAARTILQETSE